MAGSGLASSGNSTADAAESSRNGRLDKPEIGTSEELLHQISQTRPVQPVIRKRARPAVLRVGPEAPFKVPSHAAKAARNGDTIEIAPGIYEDCAIFRAHNLTIRGVGGLAHFRNVTCQRKAIFVVKGNDTVIENIEFSGMAVEDKNGAGIRHEGLGLTVRNAYFHDGEQGILSGFKKGRDVIVIEDSVFENLGRDGQAHGIYVNYSDKLIIRRSTFRNCRDEGHCVKSRAKHTILHCNVIASLDGDNSYELDFPNGGIAEIRNNVIEQGPNSQNLAIIAFAMEARLRNKRHQNMKLLLDANTIINDHPYGRLFRIRRFRNTEVNSSNNRYIGVAMPKFGTNDTQFRGRRDAALKPYPALPEACAS